MGKVDFKAVLNQRYPAPSPEISSSLLCLPLSSLMLRSLRARTTSQKFELEEVLTIWEKSWDSNYAVPALTFQIDSKGQ